MSLTGGGSGNQALRFEQVVVYGKMLAGKPKLRSYKGFNTFTKLIRIRCETLTIEQIICD